MDFEQILLETEAFVKAEAEKQAYHLSDGLPAGTEKACYDLAKSCIIYGGNLFMEFLLEKMMNQNLPKQDLNGKE